MDQEQAEKQLKETGKLPVTACRLSGREVECWVGVLARAGHVEYDHFDMLIKLIPGHYPFGMSEPTAYPFYPLL